MYGRTTLGHARYLLATHVQKNSSQTSLINIYIKLEEIYARNDITFHKACNSIPEILNCRSA